MAIQKSLLVCVGLVLFGKTICPLLGDEPQKHALVIGVEKYERSGFTDLNFAEDDARQFFELLQKSGFQAQLLLGSGTGHDKATLANIRSRLDSKFMPMVETLRKDDLVIVFLAGHGQQRVVGTQEDAFFCPCDANANQPSTWLSLSELTREISQRSQSQNNLLLIDACRNNVERNGIDGKGISLIKDNMAIFFACRFGERSLEIDAFKHGLFTYHLIQGLGGEAKDSDGEVTWDNLVSHVKKRVSASNLNQHPNEVSNLQGQSPVLAKFSGSMPSVEKPAAGNAAQAKIESLKPTLAGLEIPPALADKLTVRERMTREGIGLFDEKIAEIVYVSVPEAEVMKMGGDFDFVCEYRNDHLTEFFLRSGASSRRFQVLADRGLYIAGNVQQGYDLNRVFPADKPWILKLSRRNGLIRVFAVSPIDAAEVPVHAFEFDGDLHEVRLGIKNQGMIFSAACQGDLPSVPCDVSKVLVERFGDCKSGSLPKDWIETSPGSVGVTREFGMPCLKRFKPQASVALPASVIPMLAGDYIVECDFLVGGGGSHDASSNFDLIAMAGKETIRFPCNSYRGNIRIGDWGSQDPKTKGHAHYGSMFTRTTIRLEKRDKEIRVMMVPLNGQEPVVFHAAPASPKRITSLLVGFSENDNAPARLYEIRVEKRD